MTQSDKCTKAEPTIEWTVETVNDLLDYRRRNSQAVVDAHKAALESAKQDFAKQLAAEKAQHILDTDTLSLFHQQQLATEAQQYKREIERLKDMITDYANDRLR